FAFDGSLDPATSNPFNVFPGATALTFEQDPSNVAATSIVYPAIVVDVLDFAGANFTAGASQVTLQMIGGPSGGSMSGTTFASTGATIGGTTTVTSINGVATFSDIMLTVAGKYTLKVTDGSLVNATSNALTITPLLTKIPDPLNPGVLLNPQILVSSSTASTL